MLVKKDPGTIRSYFEDASNLCGGHADEVIIPESTSELASFLKEANSKRTPVTISGGGTGQAGGRIPFGGVLLSTEKFKRVKDVKKTDLGGYAVAEAAVLIEEIKSACDRKGLFYTYDPTEQTASVGGTIATNAKGARSFRYGPTRRYVKELKIVLADGSMLYLKRGDVKAKGRSLEFAVNGKNYNVRVPSYKMPDTKNSAGYYAEDNMDLIDLFIGQEGTLGLILEAKLEVVDKPKGLFSSFVFFKDDGLSWKFARDIKSARPLSIEYMDSNCLRLLEEKYQNVPRSAKAAIFFEDEITKDENALLEKWEKILSTHGISLDDTWVATSEKMQREFLEKRHYLGEAMGDMAKRSGFTKVHTDLAVPDGKLPEMLLFYKNNLKESGLRYFAFGHIGDAHLHVNMLPEDEKGYDKARKLELEFVKKAVSLGGTVSAEHGIGKTKKEFLKLLYGEKGIREMREVKRELDPNLILARGNIFDIE